MKIMRIVVAFLLVFCVFAFSGCGTEIASATITRDDARTGGSLSFVYDKTLKTVYVGGDGEVVQYSSENLSKGIEAGCRVGLKVTAPDETLDLTNATLEMNGVNYSSDDFLESVNGQKQRFFNIYPLVSPNDDEIKFKVMWADGTEEQEYTIIIVEGTRFMDAEGNIID